LNVQHCAEQRKKESYNGAIIFSDLIGKLDLLRVACDKCGRDDRNSNIVAGNELRD
jgi:hypothetical protein